MVVVVLAKVAAMVQKASTEAAVLDLGLWQCWKEVEKSLSLLVVR